MPCRGFAKLKKFKKSKNNSEVGGWVQVPFGFLKKIGKLSKNKVLRVYNSTLLGGACGASRCACMQHFHYPVFCDSVAVRLTKIMVHFTSAMPFAPVHGGCYIISSVGIEYSCGLSVM